MYREFYHLKRKPFQIATDHRFLWLGEKHKEALAVLQYGILDNKGFLLLTGDVGTGKTTLLNALLESLGDDFQIALINDPGLGRMDFFKFVADAFNLDKRFKSKGDFLMELRSHLLALHRQDKKTLLIIDECQHLNQTLLEEVRLLSNIEKSNTKLINIFFVGQSEFNEIILRPRNRAIRQRITINYNIKALTEAETAEYIRFRLQVAGANGAIFSAPALKEVYRFSNGYPRLINIICDHALLTGFVREKTKIGPRIVAECAEELKIQQDAAAENSVATPEAADMRAKLTDGSDTADAKGRRATRPLMLALAVVLLIWGGLLATFWLDRPTGPALGRSGEATADSQFAVSPGEGRFQSDLRPVAEPSDQAMRREVGEPRAAPVDGSTVSGGQSAPLLLPSPAPPIDVAADQTTPTLADDGEEGAPTARTPDTMPAAVVSSSSADHDSSPPALELEAIRTAFGKYPEVRFAFDSNTLAADTYDMLGLIARYCREHPASTIVLWGYTDPSGGRAYNMKLAEIRTDIVKTFLIGKGVSADAVKTVPVGPDTYGPDAMEVPLEGPRRKVLIEIRASTGRP